MVQGIEQSTGEPGIIAHEEALLSCTKRSGGSHGQGRTWCRANRIGGLPTKYIPYYSLNIYSGNLREESEVAQHVHNGLVVNRVF